MLRSLGVVVFIAIVGATGALLANKPTVARGHVIAAELMRSKPAGVKSLQCDDHIPVGMAGAVFSCRVELHTGETGDFSFVMDRNGTITARK